MNNYQVSLAELQQYKRPLSDAKSALLERKINATLKRNAGTSKPFRFEIKDKVMDINTQETFVIKELYRENGYNKVASSKYFYRECDLVKAK